MTAPVMTPDREQIVEQPYAPTHFSEVVETILETAAEMVRAHVPAFKGAGQLGTMIQRPDFAGPFRCALAIELAKLIGADNPDVSTIFSYDLAEPNLHLIALVSRPTHGHSAYIRALDHALCERMQELRVPDCSGRSGMLDVQFVTPKDVRLGIGVTGLLSAVRTAPVRIWTR